MEKAIDPLNTAQLGMGSHLQLLHRLRDVEAEVLGPRDGGFGWQWQRRVQLALAGDLLVDSIQHHLPARCRRLAVQWLVR